MTTTPILDPIPDSTSAPLPPALWVAVVVTDEGPSVLGVATSEAGAIDFIHDDLAATFGTDPWPAPDTDPNNPVRCEWYDDEGRTWLVEQATTRPPLPDSNASRRLADARSPGLHRAFGIAAPAPIIEEIR